MPSKRLPQSTRSVYWTHSCAPGLVDGPVVYSVFGDVYLTFLFLSEAGNEPAGARLQAQYVIFFLLSGEKSLPHLYASLLDSKEDRRPSTVCRNGGYQKCCATD